MNPPDIFNVSAQIDAIVASPRYLGSIWKTGALMGIEMKVEIEDHDIIQAQVECLILAINSQFPIIHVRSLLFRKVAVLTKFTQLLTDMENGGAAFYIVKTDAVAYIESRSPFCYIQNGFSV